SDFSTSLPGTTTSIPAGLPDTETIARMANEIFHAAPGAEGSLPAGAESIPGASTRFVSPTPHDLPSETRVHAALAALPQNAQAQAPAVPGALLSPPNVPVSPDIARFSDPSAFGFLEDARPLFGYAGLTPTPAPKLDSIKIPADADFRAIADEFSTSPLPRIPESHPQIGAASPQIPGAPTAPNPSELSLGYSFLNEIRQLVAVPGVETIAPSPTTLNLNESSLPIAPAETFDPISIRRDFPILDERVNGKPLIWLDNAATTQKPKSVIDRLSYYYSHENSNIHRAAHELAARATDAYEAAREKVRRFLNAPSTKEIIFVRGATEGINLIAQSWGRQNIRKGDEIVITWLEHHANIVPWQMLCSETGARLRVVPVDDSGQVLLDEYHKLLGPKTRLVSFAQVSNALGTVTPAQEMIELARRYGAKVLLDGAQAVSHMQVDVQAYDCDFYVFSGHKVFAPTGIGVVFGKYDILENTQPWQGGGNMIQDVTFEKTTYQPPPGRFEAGTGNIADAVGLGAAIDYLSRVGMVNVSRHEHDLLVYATEKLLRIPGLRLIGTAREKAGVLSFVLDGYRSEDIGAALNRQGIAVRAGHHCAQPILRRFGVESTVRPSLALYNTCEDIDALIAALWNLRQGHTSL
ncbi:MAG: SufS family cysteine desulfurase, partial [Acidobacteria bacterium]|nr:SufS family cysteine desulfurase [Acidobacteriota bacterium]